MDTEGDSRGKGGREEGFRYGGRRKILQKQMCVGEIVNLEHVEGKFHIIEEVSSGLWSWR